VSVSTVLQCGKTNRSGWSQLKFKKAQFEKENFYQNLLTYNTLISIAKVEQFIEGYRTVF